MKRCVLIALVMIVSAAMVAQASSESLSSSHFMHHEAGILSANEGQTNFRVSFENFMGRLVAASFTAIPGSPGIAVGPKRVSGQEVNLPPTETGQPAGRAMTDDVMNRDEEEEEEEDDEEEDEGEGEEDKDEEEDEGEGEGWDRMWDAPKLA